MTPVGALLPPTPILVGGDDPAVADRLVGWLEEAGYAVHRVSSAGQVLSALESGSYALVVLDTRLHDQDQYPLCARVVRRLPCLPVLDHDDPAPAQWTGGVLRQPLSRSEVLEQVRAALDRGPERLQQDDPGAPEIETGAEQAEAGAMLRRRLDELATFSALTRSLSAVLDLDVLLTQVVDAAVRLCHAEEGLLLLPDDSGVELYIRAAKGLDSETARNLRIKTGDSLAGQVFRTGQPVLIGDRGLQKIKTAYLVHSLLYVPLSIKGRTIGVLGVNNRQSERSFGLRDSELLQDLAAHAAVAIENARLYEESVLRARELSTLVQAAQVTNSTLALDRVLSSIASQFISALGVGQCYITGWEAARRTLHPLAIRYRTLWRPGSGPVLVPGDQPLLRSLLHQQQPAMATLPTPVADHLLAAWLPQYYFARGVLHVPLYATDELLGLASFYRLHSPYPDQATLQASTVALHWLALQTVITLVGGDASQRTDDLFDAAQQLLALAGADWCDIAVWNAAHQRFEVTLSYGEVIWQGGRAPVLDLRQFPQLEGLLQSPQTLTSGEGDELRQLCSVSYGRSLLVAPLGIKGQLAGLVFLTDTLHERHFTRRETELVQALVAQAANALDNARLYRDLALSLEELHRTQNRLIQAARLSAMGELAAAVAHQINNPLTTILGDAELLLSDPNRDEAERESLAAILRAGKRAHEVVRRLLTMARQKPADESPSPQDLNATVHHTLALVRSHLQQQGIQLQVELADVLPPVLAVQGELEDVWMNLLLNARDAVTRSPQPTVGIRTRLNYEQQAVEVVVWDNGTGIAPEHQPHIFEPFYTTKAPGEGTGLGLHICKQIIDKCEGSINLESTYNQGTRFIIRLPVYFGQGAHDDNTLHPGG